MKYVGSKNRHANQILPIILNDRQGRWFVEPFCGGLNLIDKVDGDRIGNDIHPYLIEMFKAVQNGWTPPDYVSEELYKNVKLNQLDYPPELVGFIGFGCSFSGKWFGGYARGNNSNGTPRNYCLESKKNILAQRPGVQDVLLFNLDYRVMSMPDNCIIYCDPPYSDTQGYGGEKFNHNEFWNWCRIKSNEGHKVYVSEYKAPKDFVELWSKSVYNTLDKDTGSKQGIERLFTYNGK